MKGKNNNGIILSYSIILFICFLLITFTIISTIKIEQRIKELENISYTETKLVEIKQFESLEIKNHIKTALIISLSLMAILLLAIIPFIIYVSNGIFIPKKNINRRMLLDFETELNNKSYLYETMTNYKNLSDRYGNAVGMFAIGINDFDSIKAKYGEKNSSLILKSVAKTIYHTCRNYDFVARYSESEFFVITPENSPRNLFLMAKRLNERMEDSKISLKNKKRIHIKTAMAIGEYQYIKELYINVQPSNLIKILVDKMRLAMLEGISIDSNNCDNHGEKRS